ncbi:hypothetical protein H0H87_010428, partial [Tephrocybe sp. NHM501043]
APSTESQTSTPSSSLSIYASASPALPSNSHISEVLKATLNDSLLPQLQQLIRQEVTLALSEVQLRSSHLNRPRSPLLPPPFTPPQPLSSQLSSGNVDAIQLLRQFYNQPDARFRSSQQEKLVQLALTGDQNFIGILPTGGGKSLVFLLPAYADQKAAEETMLPSRKTVVVIPNKALLIDTMRKATEMGIRTIQWQTSTSRSASSNAILLLVALESVTHIKFK